MRRNWFINPTKMTISSTAMTPTAHENAGFSPARMIVNSLRNNPKGGAPVIATAPASHSAPSLGKKRLTPAICAMSFVP